MSNPHTIFEKYLTENESRYTSQKKEITTEIFKMSDHFEVEDFIDNLRQSKKQFSRATVYRTIKQLLDAGLLQKIATKDGKVFYEGTSNQVQHAHVICNECGKILEIKEKKLTTLINNCCDDLGIIVEYQSLHIYGKCKDQSTCKKTS
jgi:Fur family transcriptional regulator, ferric uptake regulator